MPFDVLPHHDINYPMPQLYFPPPRPVFPWYKVITDTMDRILDAADPVKRKERQVQMAQLNLEQNALQSANAGGYEKLASQGFFFENGRLTYDPVKKYRMDLIRQNLNRNAPVPTPPYRGTSSTSTSGSSTNTDTTIPTPYSANEQLDQAINQPTTLGDTSPEDYHGLVAGRTDLNDTNIQGQRLFDDNGQPLNPTMP